MIACCRYLPSHEGGVMHFRQRRQFAREKLANKSTTPAERVDLLAEIEWWDSRIALASVGRRGAE